LGGSQKSENKGEMNFFKNFLFKILGSKKFFFKFFLNPPPKKKVFKKRKGVLFFGKFKI
jgi:hypothetical protein